MKKYAVLDSQNKVINIIVAGNLEIAELVTSSHCVLIQQEEFVDINYTYSNETFVAPENNNAEEEPPVPIPQT